jgi:hypothetical protein
VLAGCGSTRTVVRTVTVTPPFGATPIVQTFYGKIVSVTPAQGGYLMRFDPALWLSGITANVASADAMHIRCAPAKCQPVSNDHFVLDEGHATLTFVLPATVHGTVLTVGSNINGTRIDAARLAALVAQGAHAKLFENLNSGMWLRVRIDVVQTFAQQYVP